MAGLWPACCSALRRGFQSPVTNEMLTRSLWRSARAVGAAGALAGTILLAYACVQAQPPTDTGLGASSASPTAPSPTPTPPPTSGQAIAYQPDLQPIFASDCVPCHSNSRPSGRYSMSTYANVMAAVQPGNPNSPLVVTTQPGGSMYGYWSGNRQSKADMVRQWVVVYNAQQTR